MRNKKIYIRRGRLGCKSLWIMISNELKALKTNKQIIYNSLFSPILYLVFYSIGIQSTFGDIIFQGRKVSFFSYSLLGIFVMSMFKEMFQCVYRMVTDKRWGLLGLKILNGINPSIYILGISTFPVIGVATQTIILYGISSIISKVFPFYKFCVILVFLMICILFWSSILICISLMIKNYKQRDFIMNTLMLPVLFSAPLFYSFDNAPMILKIISDINPLSYQLQVMREIVFGNPEFKGIFIVLCLSVMAYLMAIFLLNRTDFQSDEH